MQKLKLSSHDTTFTSMLMVSEIALNSALEEIEQCITHKKDLPTKAHFQAIKLRINKMIEENEKINDSIIAHMSNEMANFCSQKGYRLAKWMDDKQGRV